METLEQALARHYGFDKSGLVLKPFEGGFMSENRIVSVGGAEFFLKCYLKSEDRVRDIQRAEAYFASHGIPTIVPLETTGGDTVFEFGREIYALFPFVSGVHYHRRSIPDRIVIEIANLVAAMHAIAEKHPMKMSAMFKGWSDEKALRTADDILGVIAGLSCKGDFDDLALEHVTLKKHLIQEMSVPQASVDTYPYILLHGDFHEQNLLFDEFGKIKCVFDFGEFKMGPRAHELWRSADYMFLGGDFTDESIGKVVLYLKTYNARHPISREELSAGFEIYFQMHIHSFWVESEHYLKGNRKVDRFLAARSTVYLAEHKQDLLSRVLEGVYGE